MDLVPVARIVGAHGLKGLLKVAVLTDFPERLAPGEIVFIDDVAYTVKEQVFLNGRFLVAFTEVRDRTEAEALFQKLVYAENKDPELDEGEFMVKDLIGIQVVDIHGKTLGVVKEVLGMPAQDILVVGACMIPLVRQFVKKVDLERRIIVVELIPGMFEEEETPK